MQKIESYQEIIQKVKNENSTLQNELETIKNKLSEIQNTNNKLEARFQRSKQLLHRKDFLLTRLEKLSAVGQFIPEIIHKLKNPLMGISGYAELAEIAKSKEDMLTQIEKIHPHVTKISTLLGQFRSMISLDLSEFLKFDLNMNLTETLLVLELIKPKIFEYDSVYSGEKLLVKGDQHQIHQIHYNISKIFFKAIQHDQNRTIMTKTQKIALNNIDELNLRNLIQCQYEFYWDKLKDKCKELAFVEYQSDQIEISEENLSAVFEEKYQKCQIENGILLSFQILIDIVKRHKGNLLVKSENDKTSFYFVFPIC